MILNQFLMEFKLKTLKKALLYSEELEIDLSDTADEELFKWFLASILYGNRISENIAANTYRTFVKYNLVDPEKILKAGWDFLVNPIMREGGYVRYDGKTSTQLLKNCQQLKDEYSGKLNLLHDKAADNNDLEKRLIAFHGIGPITTNIFLRELRPYWSKCDPDPLPIVLKLAKKHNIDLNAYDRKSIIFIRIEAGLIRMRHNIIEQ